ncbi:MAG TPA: substrate-binding domain-containing protein [Solirubrobacterales bacterium]|nr:substrate-binding domain-containing protein [Solirubrobacterales bacterium]
MSSSSSGSPGSRVRNCVAAVVAAALIAVAVAACGGSSDDTDSTSVAATTADSSAAAKALKQYTTKPTKLPDLPPLKSTPPSGKEVVLITRAGENSQDICNGLQAATKVLSWTSKCQYWDGTNPAQLNSMMLSAVNTGAAAIALTSPQLPTIAEALSAAKAKGTVVAVIAPVGDEIPPGVTAFIDTIPASAEGWGASLGTAIAADAAESGETAHVGVVSDPQLSEVFQPVSDAVTATLEKFCPDCTTEQIDVSFADVSANRAGEVIVSHLQAHPDINYLYFSAGLFEVGVRPSLDGAGMGEVKIFGMIPGCAQLKEMNDGGSSGWTIVPSAFDAWSAVDVAARQMTGGDPTIHNDLAEPLWLVTPETGVQSCPVPQFPENYEEQFSQLWKGNG